METQSSRPAGLPGPADSPLHIRVKHRLPPQVKKRRGDTLAPARDHFSLETAMADRRRHLARPTSLPDWSPDAFESDFERQCDSGFDAPDLSGWNADHLAVRHFY